MKGLVVVLPGRGAGPCRINILNPFPRTLGAPDGLNDSLHCSEYILRFEQNLEHVRRETSFRSKVTSANNSLTHIQTSIA